MNRIDHVRLLARYKEWMSAKVYAAASTLPHTELAANRRAFFGSLLGTLDHLIIPDTVWPKRFADHPTCAPVVDSDPPPTLAITLDARPTPDLQRVAQRRVELDRSITEWIGRLANGDLDHVLRYANSRGEIFNRSFFALLMHFFNRQTHHRGQVTTLLTQAGVDVGAKDLLLLIPDLS